MIKDEKTAQKEDKMHIFDTHAHYDDEQFDKDRDEIIKSLKKANVTKCINIGCDLNTSIKACKIAQKYDFIYTAIRHTSK